MSREQRLPFCPFLRFFTKVAVAMGRGVAGGLAPVASFWQLLSSADTFPRISVLSLILWATVERFPLFLSVEESGGGGQETAATAGPTGLQQVA
ncbi:hypothetical protein GN956_G20724 [Arapaima gigas]